VSGLSGAYARSTSVVQSVTITFQLLGNGSATLHGVAVGSDVAAADDGRPPARACWPDTRAGGADGRLRRACPQVRPDHAPGGTGPDLAVLEVS
jgi:hypothetical protein